MNNIKLFMLLIMAATSSVALADGPEYEFTTTDEGSTLVINGKGDLTTYSTSTSAQVFTSTGAANVYANNSGTKVTQGAQYIQNATYYQQVPNYVQKWTAATFPTTPDWNYLSSVTTSGTWNNSACTAANTYVYKINGIGTTAVWSVTSNHLYKFTKPVEVWNNTATGAYMYPVTYNASKWNTSKTSGKFIYKAHKNNETIRLSDASEQSNSAPSSDAGMYGDNPTTWDFYIYTSTAIENAAYDVVVDLTADGNGHVPSDWATASPNITIGARVTADNYPDQINTFSYDNDTYFCYVTSTSELTQGSNYDLSTLPNDITLLTSMDSYHEFQSSVDLTEITNGSTENVNDETFTYNDKQTYRCYATSTESLNGQTVALNNLNLLQDADLQNYYTTKYSLNLDGTRITSGNFTANSVSIGGTPTEGYVVLTSELNYSNPYYYGDEGITVLTTETIGNYVDDLSVTYRCNTNPYLYLSQDNGLTKTQLSADTDYTLTSNDIFYYVDGNSYEVIADNSTFFGTTHTDYIETNTTTLTFKDILLAQILSGSYTKVEFNNTTAESTPLTIDPEIVQIINFPNNSQNTNLTNLDLGKATLKLTGEEKFSDILENPGANYSYSNTLAEITLPLVSAVGGEVTLPSNAIPVGYNNDSAALRTVTVPNGYTKIGNDAFSTDGGYGSSKITHINLPEGLKEIGDKAFYSITNLTNINITGNKVEGRRLVFPSTLATIGESAFEGTSLTSTASDPFKLPESLKKIKASAFKNLTNLKFLELNEGLEYVGNTAFGLMSEVHDQTTITFPSTLKYLGPGSFISRWYQDIYFTGTTAPVCPVGKSAFNDWGNVTAFSANTQMGNNGFNPYHVDGSTADDAYNTGHANRENYVGSGGYYFTILHFPDGLTSDQAKTYRDITRRYVACPEGTTFSYGGDISGVNDPATPGYTFGQAFKETVSDGTSSLVYYMSSGGTLYVYTNSANVQPGYIDTYLGRQQIWPSQSQWQRNFVTVANGMEWDGKTPYRPEVTEDMFTWMKEDGLWVQANSLDYTDGKSRIPYGSDGKLFSLEDEDKTSYASLTPNEKDYLSLILYQGTRRFVLSYDGGYDIPFIIPMQGGLWWSICLPFSLTKEKVDDIFGVGTHVCLMSAVDRTVTQDSNGQNTLVLKFKNDVYRHMTERTSSTTTITTTDENGKSTTTSAKVYTYASNFNKDSDGPGQDDVVIYARESYMIFPTKDNNDAAQRNFGSPVFETGDPLPTMVQVNMEDDSNGQYYISGSDPVYRFIGNFNTTAGYETNNNVTTAVSVKIPKYSYAYGKMDGQRKFFILNTANATWSPFKSIVQNTAVNGGAEDWNNFFQKTTARVNQISLFGDDEEVTGIENIIIEVSSDNDEDLRVFNLNGSLMGNSLQGLPAGTYIQGGKAYRVK